MDLDVLYLAVNSWAAQSAFDKMVRQHWALLIHTSLSNQHMAGLCGNSDGCNLQERWTLQKMVEETDQPAAYLKEVLPKIAKLNRSGPHARLWEVQSQYKTNAADQ